eukprot:TRINITY_DN3471_c1_g1_i1.p1 TRINITY_DN3471_c1_g1~~TRINITY_DN3471_c1_g1_i1.p1  ORF type:complete len:703 (-),score=223.51 TRINITY_DN3471_c1_g1_i1:67-2175(-)
MILHSNIPVDQLPRIITERILRSMAAGSTAARDRFPRLLEILGNFPEVSKILRSEVKKIPSWMFIRWVAQMMALLDKPEGPVVIPILIEIAKLYPQAVYYPFKISSEDLKPAAKKVTAPLEKILDKPLLNNLVTSLEKLTHPEHRFKDWTESLKPLMRNKNRSEEDQRKIAEIWQEMAQDLFDAASDHGTYNKKFATTWGKNMISKFGKDGSKLVKMSNETFLSFVGESLGMMMKDMVPRTTAKMKLSDFSRTLSDFEQSDQTTGEYIEIPGQYSGLGIPNPESHIKVTSFDTDVLVMGSLRRPKRVKFRGNDEKDHPFLVKGGEDLRLDQRVEQLFSVMNEILNSDPESYKRRLSIKTYQVIPMTTKVGMIEWINNTKPLKEIIEEELAKHEGKKKDDVNILKTTGATLHDGWIKSYANRTPGKKSSLCDYYYPMFEFATRAEAVKQVARQATTLPGNLLQLGIMGLSASPENFLSLRSQFARTLSVFNIASYIIGIGDRHLENFLMNFVDGGLIGIDFGHAFGTATQFLPIPELMPFRLTRQLRDFLQPLGVEGLLKNNMIYTLGALRESKSILLNTMDVFIKEPLIDWEKLARRLSREQGGEENTNVWFPKKKIEIVQRKLDGYNPAYITVQELRESVHARQNFMKNLESAILGDAECNARARIKQRCPSVKDQVECLIDQATDANILARTYFGWAPWI